MTIDNRTPFWRRSTENRRWLRVWLYRQLERNYLAALEQLPESFAPSETATVTG